MHIKIASRRSPLALWQTRKVAALLEAAADGVTTEIVTMLTTGDKVTDKPLPRIGGKGLFTKELEEALLDGDVHCAVHSLKDLPSELPKGLAFVSSPGRANPTDALIAPKYSSFDELPDDAVIATGSLRRKAQLLAQKPGLQFRELRGNIDTRLQKLEDNGWDGIIMASAALHRMERPELITYELEVERFVPAVSQGAIGIETRDEDSPEIQLIKSIADDRTMTAVNAERRFMRILEGGCSVPLGAHCRRTRATDDAWEFSGWIGSLDGQDVLHEVRITRDPFDTAERMAQAFIEQGAREILG